MTKENEILYLLECVTPDEKSFFERLYPKGISSITNKDHAIRQIKTTILNRTKQIEKLLNENKNLKSENDNLKNEVVTLNSSISSIKEKLDESKNITYVPTPINDDDQLLLDALRNAGVDNWDGYDYAIDLYNQYKKGSY
jgi:peptidoglycan hydrolase CwlO-like protein